MIEKMMDPNIIDYYVINCAIPSQSKIVTKSILASLGYRILEQREFDQRFDSFFIFRSYTWATLQRTSLALWVSSNNLSCFCCQVV